MDNKLLFVVNFSLIGLLIWSFFIMKNNVDSTWDKKITKNSTMEFKKVSDNEYEIVKNEPEITKLSDSINDNIDDLSVIESAFSWYNEQNNEANFSTISGTKTQVIESEYKAPLSNSGNLKWFEKYLSMSDDELFKLLVNDKIGSCFIQDNWWNHRSVWRYYFKTWIRWTDQDYWWPKNDRWGSTWLLWFWAPEQTAIWESYEFTPEKNWAITFKDAVLKWACGNQETIKKNEEQKNSIYARIFKDYLAMDENVLFVKLTTWKIGTCYIQDNWWNHRSVWRYYFKTWIRWTDGDYWWPKNDRWGSTWLLWYWAPEQTAIWESYEFTPEKNWAITFKDAVLKWACWDKK